VNRITYTKGVGPRRGQLISLQTPTIKLKAHGEA
jgi:hypothetical protein